MLSTTLSSNPMQTALEEEESVDIAIRPYHPRDESAVLALHCEGQIYCHANSDGETVLTAVANTGMANRHHVWVAEMEGQVIAAIAITGSPEQVAHLLWLCVATDWQSEPLLAQSLVKTATAYVRDRGYLKLVVHTPLPALSGVGLFRRLGLVFSRERGVGGSHVLEFYMDLYAHPHSLKSNAQSRPAALTPIRL